MATDKRFVVKNGLQTENINFVSNDSVLGTANITATMLSSNTLSFSGSTGQLFSITDSMTGVIFAVNDISGVPSIEVYDDGRVRMAESFGNVIIGNSAINTSRISTSITTGILQVAGGVGIQGNINVGGTVNTFSGNVGIGTSSPTSNLHVIGTATVTSSLTTPTIYGPSSALLLGGSITGLNTATGKLYLGSSGASTSFGGGHAYIEGVNSDHFAIGVSNSEKLRIDSTGNVGIGVTSPLYRLHVVDKTTGSVTGDIARFENTPVSGGYSTITLRQNIAGGNDVSTNLGVDANKAWVGTPGNFPFAIMTNFAERLRVDTNGNIGVGTTVIPSDARFMVVGGNISLNQTGSATGYGIVFPDGTFQMTASTGAPSVGVAGTVQYSAGDGTFAGDADNFFWSSANNRLGIGTNSPSNSISVWGPTPAYFRTENSADIYEVVIGNTTSTSTTIGYSSASSPVPYGYISATASASKNITFNSAGKTGIGGTTQPKNTLDVAGAVVIGATYAGNANYMPPANSLAVQNRLGIGTSNPAVTLDARGIAYFNYNGVNNVGLTAIASPSSFSEITQYNSSGNITNYFYTNGSSWINGGNFGIGTTAPATQLQISGASAALSLRGSTWSSTPTIWFGDDSSHAMGRISYLNNGDYMTMGANGETNTLIVASGGRVGIGSTIPAATLDNTGSFKSGSGYGNFYSDYHVAQGIGRTYLYGDMLIGLAVNPQGGTRDYGIGGITALPPLSASLILSNTYGYDIGGASNYNIISVAGLNVLVNKTTNAMAFKSDGKIGIGTTAPGSVLDVTGNTSFRSNISVAGAASVTDLVVNASIQTAGTLTVNALVSNTYGWFGQNVTINSTNASTSTSTGALVVGGGIGLNGNINVGGGIYLQNDLTIREEFNLSVNSNTATSNSQVIISSFSATMYRGGKFIIFGRNGTETHITEVLLTHNYSNAYYSEYGTVYSNGSLFSVSADINDSNVRVILTPTSNSNFMFEILEQRFT